MLTRYDKFCSASSMICVVVAIALAGCSPVPAGGPDYRIQHPIAARERVFSMIVPVSAFDHGVARMHLQGVSDFAADYLRRGRGPFLISQGGGSTRIEPAMVDVLVKAGVPRHKIFIQRRMGKAPAQDSAELSFTGYTVTVPTCGDWSGQAGFDPSNQSHTNFGCAFQRNTGLMLSNPGDLSVTGDPVEGDAPSSDRIIDAFRDGKALGRPKPVLEQKEFSDVK